MKERNEIKWPIFKYIRFEEKIIVCKDKDCSQYNQPIDIAIGLFDRENNKLIGIKCAYCRGRKIENYETIIKECKEE